MLDLQDTRPKSSAHDGLRIVLVRGVPSPWSQAAKTILEIKGLRLCGGAFWMSAAPTQKSSAWSARTTGPVVAWRDGPPLNSLARHPAAGRAPCADALCSRPIRCSAHWRSASATRSWAKAASAWNRRLQMFSMAVQAGAGARMAPLIDKHGFDTGDAAAAGSPHRRHPRRPPSTQLPRATGAWRLLLRGRRVERRRHLLDGNHEHDAAATGVAVGPIRRSSRPAFTASDPADRTGSARPVSIEHRDQIFKTHFRDPVERPCRGGALHIST